jgi:hypothetical protein
VEVSADIFERERVNIAEIAIPADRISALNPSLGRAITSGAAYSKDPQLPLTTPSNAIAASPKSHDFTPADRVRRIFS